MASGAQSAVLERWLAVGPAATSLDLRECMLQPEGAAAIGAALRAGSSSLERLLLSREELRVQELLGAGAATAAKLKLSRKWLGPLDGIMIGQLIRANGALVELDLSDNMLGQRRDVAVIALSEAFGANQPPALRILSLAKNYISTEGAAALARALPTNTGLRVLNLAQNEIDGPTAVTLCEGALSNGALTSLNLSCNEIDDASVASCGSILRQSHSMRTLDLSKQKKASCSGAGTSSGAA